MKLKKGQLSDIIWIVAILLFLFTPIGFHARVQIARLFSFSPKIENQDEYQKVTHFNWNLVDLNGERLEISLENDDVLVINFWATWCPPCIAEMPSLVSLHSDYGNRVKFIFLARDEKDEVNKYLAKREYEIPVFFEIGQSPDAITTSSLPTTYIIDKKENIVLK
ncbi:hypothetical protein MTsPCn9_28860 [Croceitalea sp. MTPC9]|uniref:TlpA family protein disulfide reductase n=1 Tax=unclassified Croceitalea TaxID=2632280 RepID=UPI002B3CBC9D|nr:hypothetical protein MTsPCn6_30350 [Croceitalea sp. MTPC6]GMN17946.1 hypothetical protein MTsPCn9_28860 [Croceitalea sp. MTPC9]